MHVLISNCQKNNEKSSNLGWFGKPICNIRKEKTDIRFDSPTAEQSQWMKPTKIAKMMRIPKQIIQNERKNTYRPLEDLEEESDDDKSMCSTLNGNEELWLPEENEKRKTFIEKWKKKYNNEPNTNAHAVAEGMMKCEHCVFGTSDDIVIDCRAKCQGCGSFVSKLFKVVESHKSLSKPVMNKKKKRIGCVTKMMINNINEDIDKEDDIELKLENLKIIGEQIRDSRNKVKHQRSDDKKGWDKLSLVVDSGACDSVVDPRHLLGYCIQETKESRRGETFITASGDPIPQLGEKVAMVYIEGGALKKIRTQCTTVSKPLLSVKRMIEVGHFVGFCDQGGFLLDLHSGHLEWFREDNGNYMLDTWLVPHDKVDDLEQAINEDFQGQSKM